MSVGERVTDLVATPVVSTVKGAVTGVKVGGIGGGILGALGGGFVVGTLSYIGMVALAGGVAFLAAHIVAAGIIAATIGATLGAVAGGLGIGAMGALSGAYWGTMIGSVTGTYKGIKAFFSGRDHTMENEQQLQMMREQAFTEQAQTAALMRQQQRVAAMEGVNNPNASGNNLTKLESRQQQSPSVTIP